MPHEFVQIDTPEGGVRVVNVYCRDGNLTYRQLWVQLDLIFLHLEVIDVVDKFVYEDSLLSGHKAVAVYCPGVFRPKEKYLYSDKVIDWDTCNEVEFQLKSRGYISKLKKSAEWEGWSLEEKCVQI